MAGEETIADVKISPDGKFVSFVRAHNLFLVSIADAKERALTSGGTEAVRKGELDWVYPEELDLKTAYWWSPDSSKIAFLEMDESKVSKYPLVDFASYDGDAEEERYPVAGGNNPVVHVYTVRVDGGNATLIDTGAEENIGDDIPLQSEMSSKALSGSDGFLHVYRRQKMVMEPINGTAGSKDGGKFLRIGVEFIRRGDRIARATSGRVGSGWLFGFQLACAAASATGASIDNRAERLQARIIFERAFLIATDLDLGLDTCVWSISSVAARFKSAACLSFGFSTQSFAETNETLSYTSTIVPNFSSLLTSRAANIGIRIQP